MANLNQHWHVYEDKLCELGFPEKLINEAVKAEELGLFEMEPSNDLVKRTIEQCVKLYGNLHSDRVPLPSVLR